MLENNKSSPPKAQSILEIQGINIDVCTYMRLTFVFLLCVRVWVQYALCSASESFLCTFMIIIIIIITAVVVGLLVCWPGCR